MDAMFDCPQCAAPIVRHNELFLWCERGHRTDRLLRDTLPSPPPIVTGPVHNALGYPACPRCHAPIVDVFGQSATCAAGHSVLAGAVSPVEGPRPTPPVKLPPVLPPGAPPAAPVFRPPPVAVLRRAADITPTVVHWLWEARIPLGKLTIIDGDPDKGKSLLTVDIAARVSSGRPLPDQTEPFGPPATVLMLNTEDGAEDTIVPRLRAAGADLARIDIVECVLDEASGVESPVLLPAHAAALEERVRERGAVLIVIDPLMAHLETVNTGRDQAVRAALRPLQSMAARTGCAVVFVRHLNKATGGSAMYRGGGSIGFVGAMRSALLVGADPVDPSRRVIAAIKHNLCAKPPALAYSIAGDPPTITWHGPVDVTADTLVGAIVPAAEQALTETARATTWLREQLSDGPRDSAEMVRAAAAEGITAAVLRGARLALGVKAVRSGFGKDGRWTIALPHASTAPAPEEGAGDEAE